jgi:hypothetical protein
MRGNVLILKRKVMKTKIFITLSLLLTVFFTACEKSEIPDRTFIADGAKISFVNLAADAASTTNCETNLYFNGLRVTTQQSTVVGRLRGIPFRSSYPGNVVAAPAATTFPTSLIGMEYFNALPGQTTVVGMDTANITGHTTLFTTTYNFEKNKFYSIYAMDTRAAVSPIIVEDDIKPFGTLKKVKIRFVNAIYGVAGGRVDVWLLHQPNSEELGRAPYKVVADMDAKAVTAFTDTITSGNYKWAVVVAGTVPTAITNPVPDPLLANPLLGKPYNITFPSSVIALSASTSFAQRTTYSLLMYGQVGLTVARAPVASLFRHRLN